MYYLYVIQSQKDNDLYIGSTNDLKRRLKEHNLGKVKSTQSRAPFELIYYEAYKDEYDARFRESSLKKRGNARYHLINRIKRSLIED